MPFFSIVIPAYNRADLMGDTIRSILAQDFADLELIIVDDGSKDHSKEVVASFAEQDKRVQYVYQVNSERGAARNRGMMISTGSFIIFFDSDDIMQKDHLSTLKKVIDKNPGIHFVSTKFSLVEGTKKIPLGIDSMKEGWHDGSLFLSGTHTGVMVAINRQNPGLFPFEEDRRYATLEDWMFLIQNILRDRIYIIDQYTVLVINHDQRSSRIDNKAVIRKRLLAKDWVLKHVSLSVPEIKILETYSFRFCAIHAYLDNERAEAIRFVMKAMRSGGFSGGLLVMLLKGMAGKSLIDKLRLKS